MKKILISCLVCMCLIFSSCGSSSLQMQTPATKKEIELFLSNKKFDNMDSDFGYYFTIENEVNMKSNILNINRFTSIKGDATCLLDEFNYHYAARLEEKTITATLNGKEKVKNVIFEEVSNFKTDSGEDRDVYVFVKKETTSKNYSYKEESKTKWLSDSLFSKDIIKISNIEEYIKNLFTINSYVYIDRDDCTIVQSTISSQTIYRLYFSNNTINSLEIFIKTSDSNVKQTIEFTTPLEYNQPNDYEEYID